jgi:hypothetical protein
MGIAHGRSPMNVQARARDVPNLGGNVIFTSYHT